VVALTVAVSACGSTSSSGSASSSASSSGASASAATTAPTTAASTAAAPSIPDTGRLAGFKLAPYIQQDAKSGNLHFAYITNDLAIPYTTSQREGVANAAKTLGVHVQLLGPPTGLAQDQVSLMQTLITQHKVDGIAVAAVNVDSLQPVIKQAFDAGIPVIAAFTDQPNSKELAFIGEDNEKFGVYEGKLLAERLKGRKGKVVVISVDTAAAWSTARVAGLKQGLATNSGLSVVGPVNTGAEPGQMYNAIQNAMQANPGAIAIASVDCCSIDGAARWAQNSHSVGKVDVIGTDALNQTINYIKSGAVTFSVSQDPIGQVTGAVKDMVELETKGIAPQTKLLPPILVDRQNVAHVTPEG
jgi:simple sugar transport system substrate-binding protein/ribose transport system substrate-binding protein